MLRNVVVHLHNEQPLLADLPIEPTPGDVCLVCTNLRTTNGKVPIFVDRGDSTFVFPMAHIRFIEVHAESYELARLEASDTDAGAVGAALRLNGGGSADVAARGRAGGGDGHDKAATRPDEGDGYSIPPLERLAWVSGDIAEPPSEPPVSQPDGRDGDDGELLRRVRDA
jgi:hypothetical protein